METKNGDQQTEALESYFAIDLEMYRNWQKMEISKISSLILVACAEQPHSLVK